MLSQQKSSTQLNKEKIFIPYPPKSGVTASEENSNVKGSLLEVNQEDNYKVCQIKNSDGSCVRDLFDSNSILPKSGSYAGYKGRLSSNKDECRSSIKGQQLPTNSDLLPCPDTSSTSLHKHCPFERKQDSTKKEDGTDNVIRYSNYQLFPDYAMTSSSQKGYKPSNLPLDEILRGSSQHEENIDETPESKVSSSETNNLLSPTSPNYSVTTFLQDTPNPSTLPFGATFMNTLKKRENLDQTPGSNVPPFETKNLLSCTSPDYSANILSHIEISETSNLPPDTTLTTIYQERGNQAEMIGSKLSSSKANDASRSSTDCSATKLSQKISNPSNLPPGAIPTAMSQEEGHQAGMPESEQSTSEANNSCTSSTDYSVTKLSHKISNPSNLPPGATLTAIFQEGGKQAETPRSKDQTTISGTDNYSMYTSQSLNNYSSLSHGATPMDIVSQERSFFEKYSSPEKSTTYSPATTNVLNVSPNHESDNSNQRGSYPRSTTTITNNTSTLEEESNSSIRIASYSSDLTPIVGYKPLENKDSNQNTQFFLERNLYKFEDEKEFFQLKNGKKIKPSQMIEVLMSTKNESANILTVPYMFSGSLKDYRHVVDSMPKFQNDAFVCTQNNLIVSYKDYCEILNLFGIEGKCASNTCINVNEKYIDSYLIACIIATTNCKEETAIIMPDKTLVPYSIYSNYIHSLSICDKETISVVSPCLIPVCYRLYEEVIDACLNSNNNLPIEKNPEVYLWPTGTKIYLVPFLNVIRSCYHQPSDIIVKLPNDMILPLHTYYAFFDELSPEYKENCIVHLPNCDSKVPFHIFHEICVNYLQYSITDMKPRNG